MSRPHIQPPRGRRDHFLPQGYLRGFIDPSRTLRHRPLWCYLPRSGRWEERSPKQIGYEIGFYDFANDSLDAEHADVTFKTMEDQFPVLRNELIATGFRHWTEHLEFLCTYMQMIRARSPLYFAQKCAERTGQHIWKIAAVDAPRRKLTLENMEGRPLTRSEIHDLTLSDMRREIKLGVGWMNDFHWTVRLAPNSSEPVIASEQPLMLRSEDQLPQAINRLSSYIFFPLCWQACLVGSRVPFRKHTETFASDKLRAYRSMVFDKARNFVLSPQPIP